MLQIVAGYLPWLRSVPVVITSGKNAADKSLYFLRMNSGVFLPSNEGAKLFRPTPE